MSFWLVARIESDLEWPAKATTVSYLGHEFTLRPPDDERAADIYIKFADGETFSAAPRYHELLCRFLSALAWWYDRPASIVWAHVSSFPTRIGKGLGPALIEHFTLPDGLPTPTNDKAQLALALYREALSATHVSYQFLGYFKVINVLHESGKDQKAWIDANLATIRSGRAKRNVEELEKKHQPLSEHLYSEGRCAVAHAFNDPLVNPDRSGDLGRLEDALPIIKALAELILVEEFGIANFMSSRGHRYNY